MLLAGAALEREEVRTGGEQEVRHASAMLSYLLI